MVDGISHNFSSGEESANSLGVVTGHGPTRGSGQKMLEISRIGSGGAGSWLLPDPVSPIRPDPTWPARFHPTREQPCNVLRRVRFFG